MKKYTKISTISVVSVLCAVMMSPVLGASTVRALGGAGTYNSAASASASKNSSTATRAGTMRVGTTKRVSRPVASPTTSGTRVSGSTTATSGSTPGSRLSIGKYLGGSKVTGISGGVSDEDFAGVRDEFANQLDELQAQHDADFAELQGRVDEMSDAKQDKLTAGEFIVAEDLENNIVTVDSEALMGEVETNLQEIKDSIETKAAKTDLDSTKTALETTDGQLKSRLDKLESDSSDLSGALMNYATIKYVDDKDAAQGALIDANTQFIGNLNSLTTADRTSTVAAINEINAKVDANTATTGKLGALAYKNTVVNADVEDGAAIDPNKLALPTDGQERVLYVGTDGKAEWAPVVSTYTAPAQPN